MNTKHLLLTSYEVMVLETLLEEHIENLNSLDVYSGREKEFLKKVYAISSTKYKKMKEITK